MSRSPGGDGVTAGRSVPPAEAVKERAGAVWDDAKQAAQETVREQKDAAADGIGDVAGALRKAADRPRGEASRQSIAQLAGSAAEELERVSRALRSKDPSAMVRDVSEFARREPLAFFGLALATGFLAVRFLKASDE
jgi:hypothetical protein